MMKENVDSLEKRIKLLLFMTLFGVIVLTALAVQGNPSVS